MSKLDDGIRSGRRLIQLGVVLFLFGLLVGLAASNFGGKISLFAAPRAALSVHLIALTQGTFLAVIGLVWEKLDLKATVSRIAYWLLVYGFVAALIANLLAAIWGAGGAMLPNAVGHAQGTAYQEGIIAIGLRTAAVSQIGALLIIIWGLRRFANVESMRR